MNRIVEMTRDSAEAGGRDLFSLDADTWQLLLEIGTTFGWKPAGTIYMRKASLKQTAQESTNESSESGLLALHDYQPGNYQDYKYVNADDASAWATALSVARGSHQLGSMLDARVANGSMTLDPELAADAPFTVALDEFIQYAFGGAFAFAQAK
jgi:hypothetical protein